MKKVLDILEAHVQWFALGLGALFLLWTVYAYVLSTPVTVEGVGGGPMSPGEVDKFIVDNPVASLESKLKSTRVPEFPQQEIVPTFVKKNMGFEDVKSVALRNFPPGAHGIDVSKPTGTELPEGPEGVLVAKLPEFTPAVGLVVTHGRSFVATPPPAVAGVAPAPAPAPQPGVPVAGNDKSWVSVGFKIVMGEVATAMSDVKIPPPLFYTSVMRVELHRQEKLADGTWGNETTVKALDTQNLTPLPGDKDWQGKLSYYPWAETHQADLLQPAFFQVLQGDMWKAPVEGIQAAAPIEVAPVAFDPTQYINAPQSVINTLTSEQKRAVYKAKQDAKAKERRPAPGPRPGRGAPAEEGGFAPGGAGGAGGRNYAPYLPDEATPARPTGKAQSYQYRPPGAPGMPTPMPPGGGVEEMPTDVPPPQAGVQPGQFPLPTGAFNPRQQPDIVGWAHDTTITPGKTYRYQIVYVMKNPIFNTGNVAKDKALVEQLLIPSKKSAWSAEVSIPSTIRFFMVANPGRNDTVRFEVFVWSNGAWRNKIFEVAPGDPIGAMDGGNNFSTGWLLADIRIDPRTPDDRNAMVADTSGVLESRDYRSDNGNPDFRQLKDAAQAAAAAATAAAPGATPGGVAGPVGVSR